MSGIYLDIFLCLTTYFILLAIIFWRKIRRQRPGESGDDGEGGLPVDSGPKLDLPPGVCLPGDGPTLKVEQFEEMVA